MMMRVGGREMRVGVWSRRFGSRSRFWSHNSFIHSSFLSLIQRKYSPLFLLHIVYCQEETKWNAQGERAEGYCSFALVPVRESRLFLYLALRSNDAWAGFCIFTIDRSDRRIRFRVSVNTTYLHRITLTQCAYETFRVDDGTQGWRGCLHTVVLLW